MECAATCLWTVVDHSFLSVIDYFDVFINWFYFLVILSVRFCLDIWSIWQTSECYLVALIIRLENKCTKWLSLNKNLQMWVLFHISVVCLFKPMIDWNLPQPSDLNVISFNFSVLIQSQFKNLLCKPSKINEMNNTLWYNNKNNNNNNNNEGLCICACTHACTGTCICYNNWYILYLTSPYDR